MAATTTGAVVVAAAGVVPVAAAVPVEDVEVALGVAAPPVFV